MMCWLVTALYLLAAGISWPRIHDDMLVKHRPLEYSDRFFANIMAPLAALVWPGWFLVTIGGAWFIEWLERKDEASRNP